MSRLWTLLLCLPLLFAGCGKKGPVRPLHQPPLAAVEQVRVDPRHNALLLSFALPPGEGRAPVRFVAIYREALGADESCPSCQQPRELLVQLDLEALPASSRQGDRILYLDTRVTRGTTYNYRIQTLDARERKGPSTDATGVLEAGGQASPQGD